MDLYVERHGAGERVLFVHGAGGNSSSFYFQRKHLSNIAEVVLVDLPGHGKSPGAGCRSIADYAGRIRDVIERNGLAPCYLAGHSMGGLIAMSFALSWPDLLKGLILMTTGARIPLPAEMRESIKKGDATKTVEQMMASAFSPKTPRSFIDVAIADMMKTPAETIFGDFRACERTDLTGLMEEIALPTLIICGADDQLAPPRYSESLNRAIPNSELVTVPDAGHMVCLEKPAETNQAIERFLTRR